MKKERIKKKVNKKDYQDNIKELEKLYKHFKYYRYETNKGLVNALEIVIRIQAKILSHIGHKEGWVKEDDR